MTHLQTPTVEGDDPTAILYQHTVLAQTCLPYRNPGADVRVWERRNGVVGLRLQAGGAFHPERNRFVEVGLPYGAKPRLIMAHMNAEALRTGSPEIEMESSLTAFVRRILGRDPTGLEIRVFKDQLARLSATSIQLGMRSGHKAVTVNTHLVGSFDLWFPMDNRQRVLWPTTVRLSQEYFESLQEHAVPLQERALSALAHNVMALDAYIWLAQRLHRVPTERPQHVPWTALHEQFGWHYARRDNFRQDFKRALQLVLEQYENANVGVETAGLKLLTSDPPVPGRLVVFVRRRSDGGKAAP